MNEILKFLNSHASVRQFTDETITAEQEHAILTAAQRSPTSSNLQAYSIVSVRDYTKKTKLAELTGKQQHVARSSVFLVFCADLYRLKFLSDERGYAFHGDCTEAFIVAVVDASLAACRALMAAQALGLGGVMVGGIRNNPEQVCELIGLPELVFPVIGMSLGYPMKGTKLKPRLPLEVVGFREKYDRTNIRAAITEYDTTIAELGYLTGREVEPENYTGFTGAYSWSEHSARRMASDNPDTLRPHMLEFLRSRGFLKR